MHNASSLALLSLLTVAAVPAYADEGESALSVNAGYSGFSVPDHSPHGALIGVDYEHGVTDILWLRGSGGIGAFYDAGEPAYAAHSEVGITYVIDPLKTVPYVTLGLGAVYLQVDDSGDSDFKSGFRPLISVGGGLDWLVSPTRSYGAFARFESFLGRTALFSVGARMTWRSGFF